MTTTTKKTSITIQAIINAPIDNVWKFWTDPNHVTNWNYASDDWHTTEGENDLRPGGKFRFRMEAKDGSSGFDFIGEYDKIVYHKQIVYTIADGRKVRITFLSEGNDTTVKETFEAEQIHSIEMQKEGWQSILNNFKKYAERKNKLETLHFEININASAEKVFDFMFDDEKWKIWTYEFNPSSYFIGNWEKGSKMLFLGDDQNGGIGGMVSKIKENIPNKFLSIEHMGIVQNGEEIMSGEEVAIWSGALENYTFTEKDGVTILSVDMDSNQQFKEYFIKMWPKALNKIKLICEK